MSEMHDHLDTPDDGDDRGFRPSRRTVIAAAAWTVPAVIVASATPAWAASSLPVFFNSSGTACKLPGNSNDLYKGYAFGLTLNNSLGADTDIEIISMSISGTGLTIGLIESVSTASPPVCTDLASAAPFTFTLGDTSSIQLAIFTADATNSQAGSVVVNYSYTDGSDTVTTSQTVDLTGSTWNSGCRPFSKTTWDASTTCLEP